MVDAKYLYNNIGKDYNNTRQADPYISEKLFQLLSSQTTKSYLDIGCGTGNYTIKLAERGLNITGVDPSEVMLNYAKQNNRDINWVLGTSEQIPAANGTYDGAIGTLTIHHWTDLEKSFTELRRVLKEKSRIVVFTSTPEQMEGYWLNYYFPSALTKSMLAMPSLNKINLALENAGFAISQTEKYFVQKDLQDYFLYCGKDYPERYFDPDIRNGITSFSLLSSAEEVKEGLIKLKADIETNHFIQIKERYKNSFGDYLFIVAESK